MLIALSTVLVRSSTIKTFSVKSPKFQTYHLVVRGAPIIAYTYGKSTAQRLQQNKSPDSSKMRKGEKLP